MADEQDDVVQDEPDTTDDYQQMTPGQRAFEAYSEQAGGRSLATGQEIPPWDNTRQEVRDAWEAAARSVLDALASPEDRPESLRFDDRQHHGE